MKTTKAFKSGNSVAVRLPKSFGIAAGTELMLREEQGRYIVEPVGEPRRKFNIDKVWGSSPSLKPLDPEDRWFEEAHVAAGIDIGHR